jgi:hypothetical protein
MFVDNLIPKLPIHAMMEWCTYSHEKLSYARRRRLGDAGFGTASAIICEDFAEVSSCVHDFIFNALKLHLHSPP